MKLIPVTLRLLVANTPSALAAKAATTTVPRELRQGAARIVVLVDPKWPLTRNPLSHSYALRLWP